MIEGIHRLRSTSLTFGFGDGPGRSSASSVVYFTDFRGVNYQYEFVPDRTLLVNMIAQLQTVSTPQSLLFVESHSPDYEFFDLKCIHGERATWALVTLEIMQITIDISAYNADFLA